MLLILWAGGVRFCLRLPARVIGFAGAASRPPPESRRQRDYPAGQACSAVATMRRSASRPAPDLACTAMPWATAMT